MVEIAEIRKRVKQAIQQAKQRMAGRREAAVLVERDYAEFLSNKAVPVFRVFAQALTAEGYRFQVDTPAGGVRLVPERNAREGIELSLEPATRQAGPTVSARIHRVLGQRVETIEKPIREKTPPGSLTEEDVVSFLQREIEAFVER